MTLRKKIILSLIAIVVLMTAGIFVWAVKTGKLKFRAATGPLFNISGRINNYSTFTCPIEEVRFHWKQPGSWYDGIAYGTIDSQGNYSISAQGEIFPGVTKGKIILISTWQCGTLVEVVPITNLQVGQNLTINLNPSVYLHGYVIDSTNSGNPIAGVQVQVYSTIGHPYPLVETLQTNTDGYFVSSTILFNGTNACTLSFTKPGYLSQTTNWDQDFSQSPACLKTMILVPKTLSGFIQGQDSDSTTQVPLELAKVETEVNGKKYFTRTDKDGRYLLDFSDQATLPTTPINITASQDPDSYDSQTQPVTLSATSAVTQDFVLGRPKEDFWELPATDESQIAENSTSKFTELEEYLQDSKKPYFVSTAYAQTSETADIKGKVIDAKTRAGVQGARVRAYGILTSYSQEKTTDQNGTFYLDNFPLTDFLRIVITKDDYGLYTELSSSGSIQVTRTLSVLNKVIPLAFHLQPLSGTMELDGIHFYFYGTKAKNLRQSADPRIWKRISTVISILKSKYGYNDRVAVRIISSQVNNAFATKLSEYSGSIFIFTRMIETDDSSRIAAVVKHEFGHILFDRYFSLFIEWELMWEANNILAEMDSTRLRLPNCVDGHSHSWGLFYQHCYNTNDTGHPWDNSNELFAGFFAVRNHYLRGFSNNIPQVEAIPSKNFYRNLGIYAYEFFQTVSGNDWDHPYLGRPVIIGKIRSTDDILYGNY